MSEKTNNFYEEVMTQTTGGLIFSVVQILRKGGLETSAALRLAAFILLEEAYGESVYETLEIPRSTYLRYRREVREATKTMPEDNAAFINQSMHQVVDLLTAKTTSGGVNDDEN